MHMRLACVVLTLAACHGSEPETTSPPPRGVTPEYMGATPPSVEGYVAHRTMDVVTIDGLLNETSWEDAPWSDLFVDIEGTGRPAPTWKTRVKLVWDDSALYIGAELEEPHLWGTITRRDAVIFHDNDFEVFLDPDGDTHRYYELEINALGTVWDLFLDKPYRDGGQALDEWDIAGLQTAVALDGSLNDPTDVDRGWSVEIRIPWASLPDRSSGERGTPPKDGETWRINFSRVQWHLDADGEGYRKRTDSITGAPLSEENWVWSPQDAINMHMPEMWGIVQFSTRPARDDVSVEPLDGGAAHWLLRRVYYAERTYRLEYGRFGSVEDVGFGSSNVVLSLTDGAAGFHAFVPDEAGRWWIDQDGRLWFD
jgi:hypothetical protein